MANIQPVDLSRAKWVLAAAMATTIIISNGVQAQTQTQTQTERPKTAEDGLSCAKDSEVVLESGILEQKKFRQLAQQWRNERGARSSAAQMAMLPAYQKIIGMGRDVIPLILGELQSEGDTPDHWFWALASIAHDNPVPAKSRGKLVEMAKAWLEWGRNNGYVQVV